MKFNDLNDYCKHMVCLNFANEKGENLNNLIEYDKRFTLENPNVIRVQTDWNRYTWKLA